MMHNTDQCFWSEQKVMDIILHSAPQLVDSMIQVAVHLSSHLLFCSL